MADARITELAAQTGAAVDTLDPLVIVDVSDTSMAPTGTDKKISAGELALAVQALLDLAVASDLVTLTPADSARNVITPGDGTVVPLEIVGDDTQEESLLVLSADSPTGTTDVFLIRQGATVGGIDGPVDIFSVDDSGEVDLHLLDPGAILLFLRERPGVEGTEPLLAVVGTGTNRRSLVQISQPTGEAFELGGRVGFMVGAVTTPADDADIDPNAFTFWFDATAGAPTFNIKAKDSAGDVFTASIPLIPA